MGMFDYVICLYPLQDYPDTAPRSGFQTKDFDGHCNEYMIYSSGEIRLTRCWATNDNFSGQINVNEPLYYTGQLNFYDEYKGTWYEYDAVFKNGMLIELARNMQLV